MLFSCHYLLVSCSHILVHFGDVVVNLGDLLSLLLELYFRIGLNLLDVAHHLLHEVEVILILVDYLGLELSVSLNGRSCDVSFLLKLLLLDERLIIFCVVVVTTIGISFRLLGGSSALSELQVLLHLLFNGLLYVPEPHHHVTKAVVESLTFIFQFFLVFVLNLDHAEVLYPGIKAGEALLKLLNMTIELSSKVSVVLLCAQVVAFSI